MIQLAEPTLLLDKNKCLKNIEKIVEKAKIGNVSLRPHFKTHQSHEIGRWFRDFGVKKITASSLKMAEYFAKDGWDDITVAFPLNIHEIERINKLAENIVLNVLIVDAETVIAVAEKLKFPLNAFIEIDCGDHRTGIDPNDLAKIDRILIEIDKSQLINFKGFLTHAGHSYSAKGDKAEIAEIHEESLALITPLKARYADKYPDLIMSYGDTPTCSVMEDFGIVDEIRPGNLVFYDSVQCGVGSSLPEEIAVAMACPIVAKYPERNEIVIYGGAVHLSKDSAFLPDGKKFFGKVVNLTEKGWDTTETGAYLKSLSQEHGVIYAPADYLGNLKIGDFIGILPVHSCLTADLHSSYLTIEGERISKFRFYDQLD